MPSDKFNANRAIWRITAFLLLVAWIFVPTMEALQLTGLDFGVISLTLIAFISTALIVLWGAATHWWLIGRFDRRAAHGLCRHCAYDLTGLRDATRCPECGRAITHES